MIHFSYSIIIIKIVVGQTEIENFIDNNLNEFLRIVKTEKWWYTYKLQSTKCEFVGQGTRNNAFLGFLDFLLFKLPYYHTFK